MTDRTQEAIATATAAGWQIVSRDALGTQFRKPKQWSKGAVVVGVVLLIFWGFGLVILFLALLDYLIAKDQLAYATTEQLAAGAGPATAAAKGTPVVAKVLAGILVVIVALAMFGLLMGG
jgi:hypothetical protein